MIFTKPHSDAITTEYKNIIIQVNKYPWIWLVESPRETTFLQVSLYEWVMDYSFIKLGRFIQKRNKRLWPV